jgi:hypothetical protein
MIVRRNARISITVLMLCVMALGFAAQGSRFALELTPGPSHSGKGGWLFFSYTVHPQVAVWIETMGGDYVQTIYVTDKGESGKWTMAPKNGRPEALPVWYHVRQNLLDGISQATAKKETFYESPFLDNLVPGSYIIKLETNRSYDYNVAYPKKTAGVNGQPSVVYQAEILVGSGSQQAEFIPIGTGSPDGSDGKMYPILPGIDSALELFSRLLIFYNEK